MQAEILNVRWILALARDPDDLQTLAGLVTQLDMSLQRFRHLLRQRVGLFVVLRLPVEDLVELEKDAWTSLLVLKLVVFGTRLERRQVDFARLSIGGIGVSAVDGVVGFDLKF